MSIKSTAGLLCIGCMAYCLCSAFSFREEEKSKNWFNVAYLKCLETRLPCDCQQQAGPAFLRFDTLGAYATWSDGIIYDPNTYRLYKKGNQHLAYYTDYDTRLAFDTMVVTGRLQITGDTLHFAAFEKQNQSFVRAGRASDDFDRYDNYHVVLMNRTLAKYHYPALEKILGADSLQCGCNPELGVNFVSSKQHYWILEQKKNKVSLYEWINAPEEKTIDPVMEKKWIQTFKW